MRELPQCVYMQNDRFFAQIKIRGDKVRAPLRDTVEAAKEDLLGLRKKHGGGGHKKAAGFILPQGRHIEDLFCSG